MIDRAFRDMVAEDRATFTCIFGKYHIIFLIKNDVMVLKVFFLKKFMTGIITLISKIN